MFHTATRLLFFASTIRTRTTHAHSQSITNLVSTEGADAITPLPHRYLGLTIAREAEVHCAHTIPDRAAASALARIDLKPLLVKLLLRGEALLFPMLLAQP
jgi:hypothetical protein